MAGGLVEQFGNRGGPPKHSRWRTAQDVYDLTMKDDWPDTGPEFDGFSSTSDFREAHEAYHDARKPSAIQSIERALRFASESMRGIDLQVRRIRSSEPEDEEWIFRIWMDFQLLVVLLWRLRLAARMVHSDELIAAVDAFDREIPDLRLMRNVAQHLDEYADDSPKRRHNLADGSKRVGRRHLEVPRWSGDQFEWLGGKINVSHARTAAARLFVAIRNQRPSQT